MLRASCLSTVLAVTLAAQTSRPVAEPFVRVLPGTTTSPWPAGKAPWVVTADPFVLDASARYFEDAVECMALLYRMVFETSDALAASDWARTAPVAWHRIGDALREVTDTWDTSDPGRPEDRLERAIPALRRLTFRPVWNTPPFPADVLDPPRRARWLQFRDLAVALWGDLQAGQEGWFLWAAAAGQNPAGPRCLLPRIPDRLAGPADDPQFDALARAHALGADGVFTDPVRTRSHLLRALQRLQRDRGQQPSVRHALYQCLACLLDESTQLQEVSARHAEAPAAGVLASTEWQELRTASGAGLVARVRHADQHALVVGRPVGLPGTPHACTVVVLISPAMVAALTELEQAWARAAAAWKSCTGQPRPGFTADLVHELLALDPGAAAGETVVLGEDQRHLRARLVRWAPTTGRHRTEFVTSLAPPATSAPMPEDSWLRQRLRAEDLVPVEFRLRLDGQWRWGRGAMAACELVIDGKTIPLPELWQPGSAK